MALRIENGCVLRPEGFSESDILVTGEHIAEDGAAARRFDARGLLVLPGIVDLHGDAFERQLEPRPGVPVPIDLALAETDLHCVANGITTVFHSATLSWEPGLRSLRTWRALLAALDAQRPSLAADTRVHLRWEAYNLAALDDALADIAAGRVHLLAFNDHTPSILKKSAQATDNAKYAARAGMAPEAFHGLAAEVASRAEEVPEAQRRIAAAARAAGLPMASHDDATVAEREHFRALGAAICEFPMARDVAVAARAAGEAVVMGCPNVVRGGSHLGWASAADLAEAGLCTVLASDYLHPAMPRAPFVLAGRGRMGFSDAWALVSTNPADAAGLTDRGRIAPGQRADLVLMAPEPRPRVVATLVGGRIVHLGAGGAERLG